MKNFIVLILVIIASQNIFAQSGWVKQNPFPEADLNSSFFINENTGWIAGDSGIVKFTTNGGNTWIKRYVDSGMIINSIYFINSQKGFAAGTGGKLYKSTDGGSSWVSVTISASASFNQILFTDSFNGYLCGDNGLLYKTSNGGDTWNSININSDSYASLSFINNSTGWVSTINNKMYKTTNGGTNWILIPGAVNYQIKLKNIQFINENTGFTSGQANVSPSSPVALMTKTTNGGINWITIKSGNGFENSNVIFINDQTGFIPLGNVISKTTNSGNSWTNLILNVSVNFTNIFILPNQVGYSMGRKGSVIKTTDGNNWNFIFNGDEDSYLFNVDFLNNNTGWMSGNSYIYKTNNSGINWTKYPTNVVSGRTRCLKFVNENTGYITGFTNGSTNFFKKSSDGGATWSDMNAGFIPNSLFFINSLTGYASGSTLRKTTDAGITWSSEANLQTDVTFYLSESNGWGFKNNTIYKLNGGGNWAVIATVSTSQVNSIYFANTNTGWLSVYDGILKTTNAGINWFPLSVNGTYFNPVIQFINENSGWALATPLFGTPLIKTTNGGLNWIDVDVTIPNAYTFQSMYFLNSLTGWITSQDGQIFKTTTGGVGVKQISSEVPDYYTLSQNYPNPFNPSTKINYEIKSSGFVLLKVFDLLGKEVATLVNEKQNAGSYVVDFNSGEFNLLSGIYFYTLNAGEFKETKKMVLVK